MKKNWGDKMLFATYQSVDMIEKISESRIAPYSIWAVPVKNLHDLFLSLFCCAPNRLDTLIFFENEHFIKIDKIKWYQTISDESAEGIYDPKEYISEDTDDLHSEFLVKDISLEQIKMIIPIIEIGDAPNILPEYRGAKLNDEVQNYLMGLAMDMIANIHMPIERNVAFGMDRDYAEYRCMMSPKKFAFEMIYLPIVFHMLTADEGTHTVNIRYLANMISYNADDFFKLNDKFTMWSYDDCSLSGFDSLTTEMGHYIVDNEKLLQRLMTGPKIERNETCPCGSGKKYKKCHGFWLA